MITKEITYTNILGNEVTKVFYFSLTKVEALRLEADWAQWGGVEGRYDILSTGDEPKFIMETIEELVLRSYGEREGDHIRKSKELRDQFWASEAYSELFMNLLTSDDPKWDANEFFKGVLPKNVDLKNPEKSPSDVARERSMANMQGHQKKQPIPAKDDVVAVMPIQSEESELTREKTEDSAEVKRRLYDEFMAKKAAEKAAEEDPEFAAFLKENGQ